ncbi:hypothetical protein GCM10023149_21820 [Mucilaginibacter gynuensis]|uniref:Uncharacterized protein n=1 Tax=Mucilaginibacter gynuensis TaxID=1302236 RepID=A0ABP8GCI8_9SPHI
MFTLFIPYTVNILLIVAFIIDRIFRLRSVNEYKSAKEAQIETLKQQLENERRNNDIELTEMHKKRYQSLKVVLEEREEENDKNKEALLKLSIALEKASESNSSTKTLVDELVAEINRLALRKKKLEIEKMSLLNKIEDLLNYPNYLPYDLRNPR